MVQLLLALFAEVKVDLLELLSSSQKRNGDGECG